MAKNYKSRKTGGGVIITQESLLQQPTPPLPFSSFPGKIKGLIRKDPELHLGDCDSLPRTEEAVGAPEDSDCWVYLFIYVRFYLFTWHRQTQ